MNPFYPIHFAKIKSPNQGGCFYEFKKAIIFVLMRALAVFLAACGTDSGRDSSTLSTIKCLKQYGCFKDSRNF